MSLHYHFLASRLRCCHGVNNGEKEDAWDKCPFQHRAYLTSHWRGRDASGASAHFFKFAKLCAHIK